MLAIAAPRLTPLAKMKLLVSISSKDLTISKFTALLFNDHDFTYYTIAELGISQTYSNNRNLG